MIRNQYTISDVAPVVGLGPWTLRRLESQGRIPSPQRDPLSGRRIYTDNDVAQLRAALAHLIDERTMATSA